jgi:hypothetical protein
MNQISAPNSGPIGQPRGDVTGDSEHAHQEQIEPRTCSQGNAPRITAGEKSYRWIHMEGDLDWDQVDDCEYDSIIDSRGYGPHDQLQYLVLKRPWSNTGEAVWTAAKDLRSELEALTVYELQLLEWAFTERCTLLRIIVSKPAGLNNYDADAWLDRRVLC